MRQHSGTWDPGALQLPALLLCSGVSREACKRKLRITEEGLRNFCSKPCGLFAPAPILALLFRGDWSQIVVDAEPALVERAAGGLWPLGDEDHLEARLHQSLSLLPVTGRR